MVVTRPATLTVLRSTPLFDTTPGSFGWTDDGLQMTLGGLSGHGIILIHASTNLVDWSPILTNPPHVGTLQLLDPESVHLPWRFYRAEEQ